MTVFHSQRNAPLMVREAIRNVIDPGIKVRASLPQGWTPTDGPQVTVVGDGTFSRGRYTTAENVRVAVYHRFEPSARQLAEQIDAFLLNPHVMWGLSMSPGPGLISAWDEALGAFVCAVTVVAESPKEGVSLR